MIENLKIKGFGTTPEGNLRIYQNSGIENASARIAWTTSYKEPQKSFIVSVSYRGHLKDSPYTTAWSQVFNKTIDATDLEQAQESNGRYLWAAAFSQMGLLQHLTSGNTWAFNTRMYDDIEFQVSVQAIFTDAFAAQYGQAKSEICSGTLFIGYIPAYTITKVIYEKSDRISIYYETEGWNRPDDRYCIDRCIDTMRGAELTNTTVWGTVATCGKIEFPTTLLNDHIKNKNISMLVRFNAAYRAPQADFASAEYVGKVEDGTICNTPKIFYAPTTNKYEVAIKTADAGDKGAAIEQVTVKMVEGKYKLDEVTVACGEVAYFPFVPFNREVSFAAVGSRGSAISDMCALTSTKVNHDADTSILASVITRKEVELKYDQDFSVKTGKQREEVELAGRRRPTVLYGDGGKTDFSLNATLLEDDALDIEAFGDEGVLVLRLADGRRYALSADINLSWSNPHFKKLSITGIEVDA